MAFRIGFAVALAAAALAPTAVPALAQSYPVRPVPWPPGEALAALMRQEIPLWSQVLEAAGIKQEDL